MSRTKVVIKPEVIWTPEDLADQIRKIIEQLGEDKTDGQCLDEIIIFLKDRGFWV